MDLYAYGAKRPIVNTCTYFSLQRQTPNFAVWFLNWFDDANFSEKIPIIRNQRNGRVDARGAAAGIQHAASVTQSNKIETPRNSAAIQELAQVARQPEGGGSDAPQNHPDADDQTPAAKHVVAGLLARALSRRTDSRERGLKARDYILTNTESVLK